MEPVLLPYRTFRPALAPDLHCGPGAAVIGRTDVAESVELGPLTVLRGDGERITVGARCWLGARATVHIADEEHGSVLGAGTVVGRFALVHGCTLGERVVVGDAAVVMDRAEIGAGAVIGAGALVPPGKVLEGGRLYAGIPARPVRAVTPEEADRAGAAVRRAGPSPATATEHEPLPDLDDAAYRPAGAAGPLHPGERAAPAVAADAYVAPTAAVWGDVRLDRRASVWFSTALRAGPGRIEIGAGSNVQDNSFIDVQEAGTAAVIGNDVTIGHNVRMRDCRIGQRCLIGMGASLGSGVIVEDDAIVAARAWVAPGTVVRGGWIWAGRPAQAFRQVRSDESARFLQGKAMYETYAGQYREPGTPA